MASLASPPAPSAEERLRARKESLRGPPTPAYLPAPDRESPLKVDETLYRSIQQAPRTLVQEFTLPIRSGRAWTVPAKSVVRISTPEGHQVGT